MSIQVMGDVWKDSQAAGNDLLLLLALADHADDHGICWPSISHMAEKTRVSDSTVKRSIKTLIDLGELKIEEAGGTFFSRDSTKRLANRYRVLRGNRPYKGENTQQGGGGQNEPGPGVTAMDPARGSQLRTPNLHKQPPDKTKTKRAPALAKRISPSDPPVVVISSLGSVEEKTEAPSEDTHAVVEVLGQEFGLSLPQQAKVKAYAVRNGLDRVREVAEIVRSKPRENLGQSFMAGLRDDWKKPRSTVARKAARKTPSEPEGGPAGWPQVLHGLYPGTALGVYEVWANVPNSLQQEVREHLKGTVAAP